MPPRLKRDADDMIHSVTRAPAPLYETVPVQLDAKGVSGGE